MIAKEQLERLQRESRGLAAYSVMPANEASGIGGRSYGRIALYLQQVSLAQPCRSLHIYIYIYIYMSSALRSNNHVVAFFRSLIKAFQSFVSKGLEGSIL